LPARKKAAHELDDPNNANVDWNVFAKMYAKEYDTKPFYFTQTSPAGKVRIAAWCTDPNYCWRTAEEFLSGFPAKVDVLLKVEAEEPTENDPWDRFHRAGIDKELVLSTIHKYEDYVLGDASNEIAVRRSDTGEYVVYDSGGVLWLYLADDGKRWCEYLEARTFQLEYRKLISGVFHWNRCAHEAEKQRDGLILDLGLEPAEKAYT
jgi:hypothetical protein